MADDAHVGAHNWFLSHLHKKKETEKAGLPDGGH